MVLDTKKDGQFIFKNTYQENKQVKIAVMDNEAPNEFYFVHIERENALHTQTWPYTTEDESQTAANKRAWSQFLPNIDKISFDDTT